MKTKLKALVFLVTLTVLLVPFFPVHASLLPDTTETAVVPAFGDFVASVQDGQALVRGVYVPDVLTLPVVQQPAGDAGYVSDLPGAATQFRFAAQFDVVGLLAHNYLAGAIFSELAAGHEVRIVYGDGRVDYYVVSKIYRFQALSPDSPTSNFVDLDSGEFYTAAQLFGLVYQGGDHVTFQTCIWRDGNASWGRLFVIALPVGVIQENMQENLQASPLFAPLASVSLSVPGQVMMR